MLFSLTPFVPWLNLTHKLSRLLMLLSGIVFAVVLMFMFTGFKHALYDSQLQIFNQLKGDVFILHQGRPTLAIPKTLPRRVVDQVQGYQGVTHAAPLYLGEAFWKNPDTKRVRLARVLAFNLSQPLFNFPELQADISELQLPNTVFMDRLARPEMGRREPGTVTELADRKVRVVGNFSMGNDFASLNGNLVMSDLNFQRFFSNRDPKEGNRGLDQTDMVVLRLEHPQQAAGLVTKLRQDLPDNLQIMTRAQLEQWERRYWQESTNIGFVFGILTIMAFVIGIILCYQIIYADVADHLTEYATLKAIGYRNHFLFWIIFQESLLLALMGFIPGALLSYGLYSLAKGFTGLVFIMTGPRSLELFVLTLFMCLISGTVSIFKVQQSEPADIF